MPERNFLTASAPEAAVSTSNWFISRTAFRVSRTATSSSTSRIRRFIANLEGRYGKSQAQYGKTKSAISAPVFEGIGLSGWILRRCASLSYYRTVASFYVENFGCRATQADGAAIERHFRERGLNRA